MVYLAYFVAGAHLANGMPYFVNGISGRKFQSPFASPPGVGESSPAVIVIWGMVNFIIGVLLTFGVGEFEVGLTLDGLAVGLGFILMATILPGILGVCALDLLSG